MQATLDSFRTLFPEFAAVPDAQVDFAFEVANEITCASDNAKLFLCAHIVSLRVNEGVGSTGSEETQGSGFAVVQQVGDLRAEYVAPRPEDADFARTPYGRQYLALSKHKAIPRAV